MDQKQYGGYSRVNGAGIIEWNGHGGSGVGECNKAWSGMGQGRGGHQERIELAAERKDEVESGQE